MIQANLGVVHMSEEDGTEVRVVYEQRVKLPFSLAGSPVAWQSPFIMTLPEELRPGMKLAVTVSSQVAVSAQLFRKGQEGGNTLVSSWPHSARLSFEFPVDTAGSYLLKLYQHQRSPLADADIKIEIKVPKPKGDLGSEPPA